MEAEATASSRQEMAVAWARGTAEELYQQEKRPGGRKRMDSRPGAVQQVLKVLNKLKMS